MANRTVKDAKSIKGTNPQYLVEKIIRSRIYDSKYWKEECFALTAELLVDKAMELRFVGGVFGGNIKPTPFLCLILKMLQIQPEKDIIVEFIKNEEFKYVRALGAFYMRLTGTSMDCYSYLEPLLNDYRKLRRQNREGAFETMYMDEYVDDLLREERACDIILPRMQKRNVLEETNQLPPHISILEEDDDDDDDDDEIEEEKEDKEKKEATRKTKKVSSSKSSSTKGDRDDRRRRRSNSSDSDSSDDYDRKLKIEYRYEKDRERKGERLSDSRSQRKDKKKDRDLGYERRDRDRDRTERDRPRDKGREHGRSRDSEKDRGHHHRENRERDRESGRHRSGRRHDY